MYTHAHICIRIYVTIIIIKKEVIGLRVGGCKRGFRAVSEEGMKGSKKRGKVMQLYSN